jgi:hypothetical protein
MRRVFLFASLIALGCSSATSKPDAGADDAAADVAADGAMNPPNDAAAPSTGCDLPDNPGVMPHECSLYYGLSQHDKDAITTKCVSPGSIVSSCPKAGLVGICHFTGSAVGKSNIDVGFQFGLTGGAGASEDEYRYMTTFGDSECVAAGGMWM